MNIIWDRAHRRHRLYMGVVLLEILAMALYLLFLSPFCVPEDLRSTIHFSPLWLLIIGTYLRYTLPLGIGGIIGIVLLEILRRRLRDRWSRDLERVASRMIDSSEHGSGGHPR